MRGDVDEVPIDLGLNASSLLGGGPLGADTFFLMMVISSVEMGGAERGGARLVLG